MTGLYVIYDGQVYCYYNYAPSDEELVKAVDDARRMKWEGRIQHWQMKAA